MIDGLTSNFKHERIWAINQIFKMDSVDGQIKEHIFSLSTEDNDIEVRNLAQEAIIHLDQPPQK